MHLLEINCMRPGNLPEKIMEICSYIVLLETLCDQVMMNYDTESPSSSHADGDRQTGDDAKTTDRRNTVNSPSAEEDNGASAADWCAWCGRGSSTDQDFNVDESWPSADDDDECRQRPAYDQLRFCSRSCLSRYKMDLFCRETQRYLQQLQVLASPLIVSYHHIIRGKIEVPHNVSKIKDRYWSSLPRWLTKLVRCPSVWCQHFQNLEAPRPLGRRQ